MASTQPQFVNLEPDDMDVDSAAPASSVPVQGEHSPTPGAALAGTDNDDMDVETY